MRNYTEVKDFLKTNGFVLELHTPGQSYRNGGVLFYWKNSDFKKHPSNFKIEERGECKNGRRKLDLIKLLPNGEWNFEPYSSTRKFQDQKVWSGRVFKRYEGVKVVKGEEKLNDLEEQLL